MQPIGRPMAEGRIRFLTSAQGGRKSGPPAGPQYAANIRFGTVDGSTRSELYSIFIQRTGVEPDGTWYCLIDFVARKEIARWLTERSDFTVYEGPERPVATGVITVIYPSISRD